MLYLGGATVPWRAAPRAYKLAHYVNGGKAARTGQQRLALPRAAAALAALTGQASGRNQRRAAARTRTPRECVAVSIGAQREQNPGTVRVWRAKRSADGRYSPSTSDVSRVTLAAFLRPAGRFRPILSNLSRSNLPPFLDLALQQRNTHNTPSMTLTLTHIQSIHPLLRLRYRVWGQSAMQCPQSRIGRNSELGLRGSRIHQQSGGGPTGLNVAGVPSAGMALH